MITEYTKMKSNETEILVSSLDITLVLVYQVVSKHWYQMNRLQLEITSNDIVKAEL